MRATSYLFSPLAIGYVTSKNYRPGVNRRPPILPIWNGRNRERRTETFAKNRAGSDPGWSLPRDLALRPQRGFEPPPHLESRPTTRRALWTMRVERRNGGRVGSLGQRESIEPESHANALLGLRPSADQGLLPRRVKTRGQPYGFLDAVSNGKCQCSIEPVEFNGCLPINRGVQVVLRAMVATIEPVTCYGLFGRSEIIRKNK